MKDTLPYKISAGRGLAVLIFGAILMSVLTTLLVSVLGRTGLEQVRIFRLATIIQDLMVFIVPPFAAALLSTRHAADLLAVRSLPGWKLTLAALVVLVISVPFMESVIYWNYHLDLSFLGEKLAAAARTLEDANSAMMRMLMSDSSVGTLIVNILIVGVLAGFSEELFFRGGFQRLLTAAGVNRHVAIWLIAIIFSALHLQFYGFVPRVLLGVLFGYMLLWSGSLWLPVAMHVLNNSIYVVTVWLQVRADGIDNVDFEPSSWPVWAAAASAFLTAALLGLVYRLAAKREVLNDVKHNISD